jgi:hypothetical protein
MTIVGEKCGTGFGRSQKPQPIQFVMKSAGSPLWGRMSAWARMRQSPGPAEGSANERPAGPSTRAMRELPGTISGDLLRIGQRFPLPYSLIPAHVGLQGRLGSAVDAEVHMSDEPKKPRATTPWLAIIIIAVFSTGLARCAPSSCTNEQPPWFEPDYLRR